MTELEVSTLKKELEGDALKVVTVAGDISDSETSKKVAYCMNSLMELTHLLLDC